MRCDIVECLLLAATTTATLYKAQTILFPFYLNFFPTKIVLLYIYIVYCLMIRKNVILLQLLLFGIYQDFFALLKFEPNNKPIEKKRHKKERKTIKINGFVLQSVLFFLDGVKSVVLLFVCALRANAAFYSVSQCLGNINRFSAQEI